MRLQKKLKLKTNIVFSLHPKLIATKNPTLLKASDFFFTILD